MKKYQIIIDKMGLDSLKVQKRVNNIESAKV